MNTQYLHEFVCLAETRNFWEASEQLYMNQSTLSKHLKALEAELGVPLFARTTRHVELTAYGRAYLPYARAITRSELEGCAALKRLQNMENGLLSIGTIPSMPQYRITQLLARFQEQYPDITIRITEDDSRNLPEYLLNGSCELIFHREELHAPDPLLPDDDRICRIPYLTDRMVAVLPAAHPLAKASEVTLQDLSGSQFCFIREGSLMYEISMTACRNAGFVPDILFSSHHIASLLDMIRNRNCVGLLMDRHVMEPPENAGWTAVPLKPEIRSRISLCYRTDKPLSAAAQEFLDFYIKWTGHLM